jgi:voltage-gated sodium channel
MRIVVSMCRRLVASPRFGNFITLVIIFAGVMVGIETNAELAGRHRQTIDIIDHLVLLIFAGEVVLRMLAEAPRPWRYFRDPWNCFDFAIVVGALMPFVANYAVLLRLFRLLRVLKLVRSLPRLRRLVAALLFSLPSMGYVLVLLVMLFYVYGCAGVFFFGEHAPEHFGSLTAALLSLFQLVTLDGWVDMYQAVVPHASFAVAYFVSFILLGTMVMLNLVIGVIVQGMEEAKNTDEEEGAQAVETSALKSELATLQNALASLAHRTSRIAELVGKMPVPPASGSPAPVAQRPNPQAQPHPQPARMPAHAMPQPHPQYAMQHPQAAMQQPLHPPPPQSMPPRSVPPASMPGYPMAHPQHAVPMQQGRSQHGGPPPAYPAPGGPPPPQAPPGRRR